MSLPAADPDHTVVIPGAPSGIGAELSRELAARGHGLTLVARRRGRLDRLAGELRTAHGVQIDIRCCDLADAADRARLIAELRDDERRIAGVCNNAGYGSVGA